MPNDYTKTAIKAAFIRLLNERPLNKISVKSIVDICNISRNTFYYHYQDIPSLLEEIIIEAANTLTQQHDTALSMEISSFRTRSQEKSRANSVALTASGFSSRPAV